MQIYQPYTVYSMNIENELINMPMNKANIVIYKKGYFTMQNI